MIINAPEKFTAREYEEIRINQEEAEKTLAAIRELGKE